MSKKFTTSSYTGKDSRPMNLRVPLTVRKVIELAARAVGESLTTFMLRAAVSRAKVILSTETALIDKADQEVRYHGLRY